MSSEFTSHGLPRNLTEQKSHGFAWEPATNYALARFLLISALLLSMWIAIRNRETDMFKSPIGSVVSIALIGALAAAPSGAIGAPVTYDFTVALTSGSLAPATLLGDFTFDDSIIPVGGGPVDGNGLLTDLNFSFDGVTYDETTINTGGLFFAFGGSGDLAGFVFGTNCQSGTCTGTGVVMNSVVFNAYDPGVFTPAHHGDVTFSLRNSVPEPGTLALLGIAFAGLGYSRRKQ